jgi:hypothetical protein
METPAGGPGLQGGRQNRNAPPDNVPPDQRQRLVDPLAAWLLRASARYHLVREGAMTLDEAFDNAFVCDFLEATGACQCHTSITRSFDRVARELREDRLRRWRRERP